MTQFRVARQFFEARNLSLLHVSRQGPITNLYKFVQHDLYDIMALVKTSQDVDYVIQPEAVTPALNSSDWPLLLKNYTDRKLCCTLHQLPS